MRYPSNVRRKAPSQNSEDFPPTFEKFFDRELKQPKPANDAPAFRRYYPPPVQFGRKVPVARIPIPRVPAVGAAFFLIAVLTANPIAPTRPKGRWIKTGGDFSYAPPYSGRATHQSEFAFQPDFIGRPITGQAIPVEPLGSPIRVGANTLGYWIPSADNTGNPLTDRWGQESSWREDLSQPDYQGEPGTGTSTQLVPSFVNVPLVVGEPIAFPEPDPFGSPDPRLRPPPRPRPTSTPDNPLDPAPGPQRAEPPATDRLIPSRGSKPSDRPAQRTDIAPGAGVKTGPATHSSKPPPPGEVERKVAIKSKAVRIVTNIVNGVTESLDVINSLWDALPKQYQTRKRGERTTPQQKTADLIKHYEQIDINAAIYNIGVNQIEDYVFGRAGQALGKASKKNPFGRPLGYGAGEAL